MKQKSTVELPLPSRGGGGGTDLYIKVTGVIVGHFEKNPSKIPESGFMGVFFFDKTFYGC